MHFIISLTKIAFFEKTNELNRYTKECIVGKFKPLMNMLPLPLCIKQKAGARHLL